MKRENEFAVGVVVIAAFALIVAGALWLSGARLGRAEALYTARFRTVGGLGVGKPVVLRGVRVGRVEAIRLASGNWVEADLRVYQDVALPPRPAVVAASASLFGEWAASRGRPTNVHAQLTGVGAGGRWQGDPADVGQLTAQAGRIAGDIAAVASRFRTAFDSQAASDLRRSIRDFADMADRLAKATAEQADVISAIGGNLQRSSEGARRGAEAFAATAARVDSATSQGQVGTLVDNAAAASTDLRAASTDLRSLLAAAQQNQQSIVNILVGADSLMSRVVNRSGSLGLLVGDSTLYQEATLTLIQLRQLLADIQANPRRYFTFSVF
jgi:phospholipid/cholesterol/gamma-HCH transport system substrate-binding protein